MKRIIIRETEEIRIGEGKDQLTEKELELLEKFITIKKLNKEFFKKEFKKIKIINYVGFIQFKNFSIEILPKISLDNNNKENRKILYNMLKESKYLNVTYNYLSIIDLEKESLLEIMAYIFSEKLSLEIQKGLHRNYIAIDDNIGFIKGKILLKNQINNIMKNNNKVACRYEEFSHFTVLNSIFKSSALYLIKNIKSLKTIDLLQKVLMILGDIPEIQITEKLLRNIKLDRLSDRFVESLELVRIIFNNQGNLGGDSKNFNISILFEIQDLYENYIGAVLKKLYLEEVTLQEEKEFLLKLASDPKRIIPDFVIRRGEKIIILDTKWKFFNQNEKKLEYERADYYQMFAYIINYNASSGILLYPWCIENKGKEESWNLAIDTNKKIERKVIRLKNIQETKEDLKNIIEQL